MEIVKHDRDTEILYAKYWRLEIIIKQKNQGKYPWVLFSFEQCISTPVEIFQILLIFTP